MNLARIRPGLLRQTTRAALAAAAVRSRKGARRPVVDADKLERVRSVVAKELTVRETATRPLINKATLCGALRAGAAAFNSP
jgi:hypothetical protein